MANKPFDTNLFDKAAQFAINAHHCTERRGKASPYIIHCMEAAAIVESITNDQELLAAAILHDTVEDTDTTIEQIRAEFGDRVAKLVAAESIEVPEGESEESSWHARKQASMDMISSGDYDFQVVAMGDKLSNMRAIYRDYLAIGDKLWDRFHAKDKADHAWHYRGIAKSFTLLKDTPAYREFKKLCDLTFGEE